jgi:hypothetical protein
MTRGDEEQRAPGEAPGTPGDVVCEGDAATDARSLGPCCWWMEERRLSYEFVARARSGVEMARSWSR